MKRVRFGIDVRRQLTGADLYIKIFQVSAILPAVYIAATAAYPPLLIQRSIFSAVFDLGMSLLPRALTLALSSIFRVTGSEVRICFIPLVLALALGLIGDRVLRGSRRRAILVHKVCIALIAADLMLRLVPLRYNLVFGWPAAIAGFLVRAVCIALLVLDLRADRKQRDSDTK
ncbi:MAG: hypothetical protein IJH91_00795 [Mogibacterium sp.]|nr:hypothetical protein [Mogibacterium sp.]